MDTNLNIPAHKKVVSVEVLHLDEPGYGPQGKHTRREWRAECLENLLAGKDVFMSWQDNWTIDNELGRKSFAVIAQYDDGVKLETLSEFSESSAPYTIDYSGQSFDLLTDLDGVVFRNKTLFNSAVFWWGGFQGVTFNREVDFRGVIFDQFALISDVNFNGTADFSNAYFTSHADFSNTIFKEDAYFFGCIFMWDANFFKTKFFNQCRFNNTQNLQTKEWRTADSKFYGVVNFENTEIQNIGHFERVHFKGEIPNFLGVDNAKTLLIFSGNDYFNKNDNSEDAINRIGQLKRLSDEHGQTDQALRFNAIELQLKRLSPNTDVGFKIVTWLYEKLSNYGQSFIRPLIGYIALLVISATIAMIYSTYSVSPTVEQQVLCKPIKDQPPPLKLTYGRAVVEYAMFRAGGLMDFTDTGKQNNAVNCRLFEEPIEPPLMRAWGIFKGIASIALLFLAALGLRNKYRIK